MALIPADKLQHLKWGAGLAGLLIGTLAIGKYVAPWAAVVAGQVALAAGVEWYQKVRNEGTPSVMDAAATFAPGAALGGVVYFLG